MAPAGLELPLLPEEMAAPSQIPSTEAAPLAQISNGDADCVTVGNAASSPEDEGVDEPERDAVLVREPVREAADEAVGEGVGVRGRDAVRVIDTEGEEVGCADPLGLDDCEPVPEAEGDSDIDPLSVTEAVLDPDRVFDGVADLVALLLGVVDDSCVADIDCVTPPLTEAVAVALVVNDQDGVEAEDDEPLSLGEAERITLDDNAWERDDVELLDTT